MISMNSFLESNKYAITDIELGRGSSGIVFAAESTDPSQSSLAIKVVQCTRASQEKVIKSEYQILSRIKSTHVVRAIDLLHYESQNVNIFLIVMERCACKYEGGISREVGGSGNNYLKKKVCTICYQFDKGNLVQYLKQQQGKQYKFEFQEDVYRISLQLLKGIQEIHAQNILHLDIKPTNIMLGKDKQWKYIDMGISEILREQHQMYAIESNGLTELYASPEQFEAFSKRSTAGVQNALISKASDIYSLGLVFMEMSGGILDRSKIAHHKQRGGNVLESLMSSQFLKFNQTVLNRMLEYVSERRAQPEQMERTLSALLFEAQLEIQMQSKGFQVKKEDEQMPEALYLSSKQQSSQRSQVFQEPLPSENSNIAIGKMSFRQAINAQPSRNSTYETSHLMKASPIASRNSFKINQLVYNQDASSSQQQQQQQQLQQFQLQARAYRGSCIVKQNY